MNCPAVGRHGSDDSNEPGGWPHENSGFQSDVLPESRVPRWWTQEPKLLGGWLQIRSEGISISPATGRKHRSGGRSQQRPCANMRSAKTDNELRSEVMVSHQLLGARISRLQHEISSAKPYHLAEPAAFDFELAGVRPFQNRAVKFNSTVGACASTLSSTRNLRSNSSSIS